MTQRIGGFYQLAASPEARITHLVGSGAGNSTDRLWVGNDASSLSRISVDPFKGVGSAASDRAWDGPTFPLSISGAQGEFAMKVDHSSDSPYDCFVVVAIVTSAIVEDTDKDGMLNQWETDGRISEDHLRCRRQCHERALSANVRRERSPPIPPTAWTFRRWERYRFAKTSSSSSATCGARRDDLRNHVTEGRSCARSPADPEALEKVGKAFDNAPVAINFTSISETTLHPVQSRNPTSFATRRRLIWRGAVKLYVENRRAWISSGKSGDVRVLGVSRAAVPWKTGFRFLRDESLNYRKFVAGINKVRTKPRVSPPRQTTSTARPAFRRFRFQQEGRTAFDTDSGLTRWAQAKVDDSECPARCGRLYPEEHLRCRRWRRERRWRLHDLVRARLGPMWAMKAQAQAATFMHDSVTRCAFGTARLSRHERNTNARPKPTASRTIRAS